MKGLLLLVFNCLLALMNAQHTQQYKCYHIQECMWNPKTQKHDLFVESSDKSMFVVNSENKTIVQFNRDGNSTITAIESVSHDDENGVSSIITTSPSNGYKLIYNVNSDFRFIEVYAVRMGSKLLVKKYRIIS